MPSALVPLLSIAAIVGTGVMAGLFFVFSFAVMDALRQMPEQEGMRAMQLINRTILNPVFLGGFMGTALICLVVAALSVWFQPPGFGWLVAGSVMYLLGGFGITAGCNVPLNNTLDGLALDSEEGLRFWRSYLERWTRWNHLRTAACILATTLLAIGVAAPG